MYKLLAVMQPQRQQNNQHLPFTLGKQLDLDPSDDELADRRLAVRARHRLLDLLPILLGQLRRSEFDGEFVDHAVEAERYLVILVADRRSRVDAIGDASSTFAPR
jgi:hypothetical protein